MIRQARVQDVPGIQQLVNSYAEKGRMLPLSRHEVYEMMRDFSVFEEGGKIVGVCALRICWEDLAEIRSLAVAPKHLGQRIGSAPVQAKVEEAESLGVRRIFALTYDPDFFVKLGFKPIDKSSLPHKVWADCIKCVKFPDCVEEAVILELL